MNIHYFALLFLVSVTCSTTTDVEEDEGVLILNENNFEEVVAETKLLLVEFYAPWCGHCKNLAPHYAKAAQQLRREEGAVGTARLAKVDCTRHKKLAERHSIRSYPTLKLHTGDRWVDYEGEHTAEAIAAWVRRRAGPPAVTITTADQAETFLAQSEAAVVGFFAGGAGAGSFLEWAEREESLPCALATTTEVADKLDAADGSVAIFKKYDELRHDLSGPVDSVDELAAWVDRLAPPLLLRFGDNTADDVFDSSGDGTLLLFTPADGELFEETTAVTRAVARDHRGEMLFTWVDVNEKSFSRVLEFFGVKPSDAPTVRVVRPSDMTKYRSEKGGPPTRESLQELVTAYLGGELKPYLLSEDLPADWDAKPVRYLVGSNFDTVALDKSKTVLVDFYAPWCGHCRKLEPELDKLGEKYKDSKTVLIAKMDATQNELTHTRPRSFPTIKMWKKGTNEVVEYNGERTVGGMTKFIETGGEYGKAPPEEDDYDDDEDFEYSEDYTDDDEYAGHDEL
ncbi:Protein disulfide-isomerase [Amphibalanus amphitrite]|uniref:Protein disulfide-isomerase n=1 Tax=Amphibalanus amphitrite TaxID=1232801 RepID=A0A6A4VRP1_AMPAM|nr:Protein disulfide-isomerase [Amphibalanus amphitrite]KAF0295580.1 Protein disulfide-isomerase [Amphibalanus amphitrite]